jgi:hypothetical protein
MATVAPGSIVRPGHRQEKRPKVGETGWSDSVTSPARAAASGPSKTKARPCASVRPKATQRSAVAGSETSMAVSPLDVRSTSRPAPLAWLSTRRSTVMGATVGLRSSSR